MTTTQTAPQTAPQTTAPAGSGQAGSANGTLITQNAIEQFLYREARYLDERRCPDCNMFCRRIGAGGTCPHCDEPVALDELTDQEVTMPIN